VSVLLRVAYDGTDFHGFARQRGTEPRTVQGELERALAALYGEAVTVRGASRTDAGVHALGQLVAFDPPRAIPAAGVAKALADRLPRDLTVTAAWEEPDADPRRGNLGKRYRYRIRCTRADDPLTARWEWHHGRPLDGPAMQQAAWRLLGTHDFASFRAAGCQATTTCRTLSAVDVTWRPCPTGIASDRGRLGEDGGDAARVEVVVEGTAFLYNMVRIIVGTLVEVGRGRRDAAWIDEVLAARERGAAGPTAPAQRT
jgi:tRNA pseudouridine38-40 synthase